MAHTTRSPGTTGVCFSVIAINAKQRKPGYKKSIGVKFKEHSGLKVIGIFIILLSQDNSPERKS